jgi:Docking domain of Afi1 for Arf3 in vesicle trafficking
MSYPYPYIYPLAQMPKATARAKAPATKAAAAPAAMMQRPTTRGTTGTTDTTGSSNGSAPNRRTSLSSFPSSRSPSAMSRHSRPSRSPNPPMIDTDRTSNPSSNSKTPSSGVSSQHSSLSVPRKYNPDAHPRRKLRSQYPRGETENHVEYILVASFDIDKGPIMEHQYPVAITGDEHMLAELMLPDQAHVRNQDWTIFFLHKDTSQEEEEAELKQEKKRRRQRRRDRAAGLLAPDDVESAEELEVAGESAEDSDESEPEGGEGPPLIYVLNLVNTKQDKTAKRGAVVKAMAICTRHPFLHIYKVCALSFFSKYS